MVFQIAVTWERVTDWEGIAYLWSNMRAYGRGWSMENGALSAWLEVEFVLFKNWEIGCPGSSHNPLQQWWCLSWLWPKTRCTRCGRSHRPHHGNSVSFFSAPTLVFSLSPIHRHCSGCRHSSDRREKRPVWYRPRRRPRVLKRKPGLGLRNQEWRRRAVQYEGGAHTWGSGLLCVPLVTVAALCDSR